MGYWACVRVKGRWAWGIYIATLGLCVRARNALRASAAIAHQGPGPEFHPSPPRMAALRWDDPDERPEPGYPRRGDETAAAEKERLLRHKRRAEAARYVEERAAAERAQRQRLEETRRQTPMDGGKQSGEKWSSQGQSSADQWGSSTWGWSGEGGWGA